MKLVRLKVTLCILHHPSFFSISGVCSSFLVCFDLFRLSVTLCGNIN